MKRTSEPRSSRLSRAASSILMFSPPQGSSHHRELAGLRRTSRRFRDSPLRGRQPNPHLPRSMLPFRSARRSAQAPLIVAAAIASAGYIFIWVHASERMNGMLGVGEVPGL